MYLIGGQLQREAYRLVGPPAPDADPEDFRLVAYTYLSLIDTGDQGRFDRASTCRPQIYRFYAPDGALETHTPSCSGRGTAHSQMVQIVDWDRIVEMDEKLYELVTRPNPPSWQEIMATAKPDISQADVRVYCTCEDFLYSGAAYFSTSTNSAVPGYEESRVPTRTWKLQVRNMVCKHLIAVYYDFFEFG